MSWPETKARVDASCIVSLGESVLHERLNDGTQTTITAVLERGAQFEANNPGLAAAAFIELTALSQMPVKGDKVIFDSRIHEVVTADPDSPGAVYLRLRYLQDVVA